MSLPGVLRGLPEVQRLGALDLVVAVLPDDVKDRFGDFAAEPDSKIADTLIRLRSGMRRRRAGETFVHELLHGCWHERGLPDNDRIEEAVIRPLSGGLFAWIRDNERAARWLLRMAK